MWFHPQRKLNVWWYGVYYIYYLVLFWCEYNEYFYEVILYSVIYQLRKYICLWLWNILNLGYRSYWTKLVGCDYECMNFVCYERCVSLKNPRFFPKALICSYTTHAKVMSGKLCFWPCSISVDVNVEFYGYNKKGVFKLLLNNSTTSTTRICEILFKSTLYHQ